MSDEYMNCFCTIKRTRKNNMNEDGLCSGGVKDDFDTLGCNECPFYQKIKKR